MIPPVIEVSARVTVAPPKERAELIEPAIVFARVEVAQEAKKKISTLTPILAKSKGQVNEEEDNNSVAKHKGVVIGTALLPIPAPSESEEERSDFGGVSSFN